MTKEEKELLLKDICARLPYGVIVYDYDKEETREMGLGTLHDIMFNDLECKPYLRPLSSMTEEELKTFYKIEDMEHPVIRNIPQPNWHFSVDGIDWLLSKQFDYRGLIEMDLALEAPKDMYK